MQIVKVSKHGIEAELPKEMKVAIQKMDKQTFVMAYLKKDKFHEEVVGDLSNEPQAQFMKDNIDKFFEIEKRRRGILDIGGRI